MDKWKGEKVDTSHMSASPRAAPPARAEGQNVQVVCRVRPSNKIEHNKGAKDCVKIPNDTEIQIDHDGTHKFNFDRVFGPDSTQQGVFEAAATPLINDVLEGFNATIFAYGQTGTGKTHTMEGVVHDPELKGIIPRVVEAIFEGVEQAETHLEFMIKVSYVEIYLEKIRDLLDPHRVKTNLTIREDKIKGIYIAGVTEEYVTSSDELLQVMSVGAQNRQVAATGMNEGSSRSHSVFTITVFQRDTTNEATKSGKLVLVDLAGSEMIGKTGASGTRLDEAKTINKSLSALGQVISALTDKSSSHIPYRDSKLTRVLQESLGGNSKTVLIIAVSPSTFNATESISTMRFGTRAKSIENQATVNQTRTVEQLEVLLLAAEKSVATQNVRILALTSQLQSSGQVIIDPTAPAQEGVERLTLTHEVGGGVRRRSLAPSEGGSTPLGMEEMMGELEELRALNNTQSQLIVSQQGQIDSLTNELEDEKNEVQQQKSEVSNLSKLLDVHNDSASILQELHQTIDGLKERNETLMREKVEAIGDLESVRNSLQEDINKLRYDMMEVEVSMGTLHIENKGLKDEIADLSGDPRLGTLNSAGNSVKFSRKQSVYSDNVLSQDAIQTMTSPKFLSPRARDSMGSMGSFDNFEGPSDTRNSMEEYLDSFNAACETHALTEDAKTAFYDILESFSKFQEQSIAAIEVGVEEDRKLHDKRVKDLDHQRKKLEKDVETKLLHSLELTEKFGKMSSLNGTEVAALLTDKEKTNKRSLQQRLEQLVAVHRQLLRKFAALELEASEIRKKIELRDQRIKQLETGQKSLIGNIREQAEGYRAELTLFREQIHELKAEHDERVKLLSFQHVPQSLSGGGGGGKIGGGGGGKSRPKSMRAPSIIRPNPTIEGGGSAEKKTTITFRDRDI